MVGIRSFFFYIFYGDQFLKPVEKTLSLKSFSFSALVDGYISDVYVEDRVENQQEQANRDGRLRKLVEKKKKKNICRFRYRR